MVAYYNEFDPKAAAWLRELIRCGLIAPGDDVDERSIVDVRHNELQGYTQHHFFAGIGVWSHALRLAGWPDDRPVWTGSCPCQPLSSAGKRKGHADERHLWPAFFGLIAECRPPVVIGEQVASKDGREWYAAVRADLEAVGYAVGAADLCAAGVGAPHIRQRLYWLANADGTGRRQAGLLAANRLSTNGKGATDRPSYGGASGRLADADSTRRRLEPQRHGEPLAEREAGKSGADHAGRGDDGRLEIRGASGHIAGVKWGEYHQPRPGPTNGFWRDADWLGCRDGKWRPVEPSTFPLVDGAPARVGRLRGYGNAIVAPLAAEFIGAVMEVIE